MKSVNLLPERHRPRRTGGRAGVAWVVLGVLVGVLVLAVVYVLSANQVNSRKTQAEKAQQDAARLEAQTAALRPFGDFAKVKATRLASVKGLADARFDWERFLRELALVLPSGAWLSGVDASALGEPEGSSSGSGSAASTGLGSPTADLDGCAHGQTGVAQLMVRLRRMHAVQDVTLKQSGKTDSGSSSTTASSSSSTALGTGSCGRFYAFSVSVAFKPQAGSGPGGGKPVPASLGGGS